MQGAIFSNKNIILNCTIFLYHIPVGFLVNVHFTVFASLISLSAPFLFSSFSFLILQIMLDTIH